MKLCLPFYVLIIFILGSTVSYSQLNAPEIKKLKINKIIKNVVSDDSDSESIEAIEYDMNGNEIGSFIDGIQVTKNVNQYNKAGKLTQVKVHDVMGNNSIISTTVYTYKTDGSFSSKTTINGFGTEINRWFDKAGRITKKIVVGDDEELYNYDKNGKLISVATKPGSSSGDVNDLKYKYNSKGQRIEELSEGTYRWTRTYSYDDKGMLAQEVTVATDEGEQTTTTVTYKYEFRK